jgi:hypothetical protein
MKAARTKGARTARSRKTHGQQSPGRQKDRFAHLDPKLAALARKQWPEKGREERIARAEQAWKEALEIASTFKKIDKETWKRIAQSKELEDI